MVRGSIRGTLRGGKKGIIIEDIKSGKYDNVVHLSRGEFVGLEDYSKGWDKPIEKKNIDITELEGMLAYSSLTGSDLGEKFIDYLNGSSDEGLIKCSITIASC